MGTEKMSKKGTMKSRLEKERKREKGCVELTKKEEVKENKKMKERVRCV